jgi:hypothetical protein
MAIKAAVVAEDELVEVGVDVLTAEMIVGAETPTLQGREDPMNPLQRNVRRHVADDGGIMPLAFQSRNGRVSIGDHG